MSNPETALHPSAMSEDDRKALMASDPAAFDLDAPETTDDEDDSKDPWNQPAPGDEPAAGQDVPQGGTQPGADAGATGATGAAEPAAAGATGATGSAQPAAAGEPRIPKARLDEVIAQRNAAEEKAEAAQRELEQLRAQKAQAAAPKDFDAEFAKVQEEFDAGDITQADYTRRVRELTKEESAWTATQAVRAEREQQLTAQVAQGWEAQVAALQVANPGYFGTAEAPNTANIGAFARAVKAAEVLNADEHGVCRLSDAALLEAASKIAFDKAGYQPPAPPKSPQQDPRAARFRQNAEAVTRGAQQPPNPQGQGARGDADRKHDLSGLKPGSFSKNFTKQQQEELLGEGAV